MMLLHGAVPRQGVSLHTKTGGNVKLRLESDVLQQGHTLNKRQRCNILYIFLSKFLLFAIKYKDQLGIFYFQGDFKNNQLIFF